MSQVNLSAPWLTYFREIEALFGGDPDVTVAYGNEPEIKLYVTGQDKADAIAQLLPTEKSFGGVTAYVNVIPANNGTSKADLFKKAFEGNPAFSRLVTAKGIFTNPISYCVFVREVVQFWNDNLGDINGNVSTLYEDIANELFDDTEGVCFCTESKK